MTEKDCFYENSRSAHKQIATGFTCSYVITYPADEFAVAASDLVFCFEPVRVDQMDPRIQRKVSRLPRLSVSLAPRPASVSACH